MQSPAMMPAPAPTRKGMPGWLLALLIGLGGLFVMGPILIVLAIYGVRKYIAAAKQAEARNAVAQIAKDAAAAYAGHSGPDGARGLCASASQSVPPKASMIRGMKYQSAPADWTIDAPRNAGFACLHFSMDRPQYYMYSYRASGKASPGDAFEAMANGDLNGNGVLSTLWLAGQIQPGGALAVDPMLHETNPDE